MPDFRDLTLYVIRHGECEHNVAGRAASWDDSPLTARGREQARANGVLLKEIAGDLSGFDFFASPLHRTCNTMELVREAAGLPPTGYRADRRLMEIDFGDFTWMTREEIAAHPQAPPPGLSWDDWDYVPPNGESWAGVHDRVGRFLQTLSRDAVIVTHYGPARTIRAHYLDIAPTQAIRHRQAHAGILRLSACAETVFDV
jgi:broad specificity phosphatase PhoE